MNKRRKLPDMKNLFCLVSLFWLISPSRWATLAPYWIIFRISSASSIHSKTRKSKASFVTSVGLFYQIEFIIRDGINISSRGLKQFIIFDHIIGSCSDNVSQFCFKYKKQLFEFKTVIHIQYFSYFTPQHQSKSLFTVN